MVVISILIIINFSLEKKLFYIFFDIILQKCMCLPSTYNKLIFNANKITVSLLIFIKIQTFWEFFDHFDSVLSSPYVVRVTRTLTYMVYLVHLNACAYYYVSVKEGLATNNWVFNGQGNA